MAISLELLNRIEFSDRHFKTVRKHLQILVTECIKSQTVILGELFKCDPLMKKASPV